jgi:hypothetical protein
MQQAQAGAARMRRAGLDDGTRDDRADVVRTPGDQC